TPILPYPLPPPLLTSAQFLANMSQQTNPPTPSSTITMLGAEGPSTKSSPIHAADHIAMSAGGYSDS
ncbi:hypothetical protein GGF41_005953, partial [Coemansia sp. RSA 2531]